MTTTTAYRSTRLNATITVNNTDATGSNACVDMKFRRRSGESVVAFVARVRRSVSAMVTRACREIGERTDA